MPTFSFYLIDSRDHIVRKALGDCDEHEVNSLAAELLKDEKDGVKAVEVWDRERRLGRIDRG